jgi:hypothetical protein
MCEDGSPWFFQRAPIASLKFAMPIENDADPIRRSQPDTSLSRKSGTKTIFSHHPERARREVASALAHDSVLGELKTGVISCAERSLGPTFHLASANSLDEPLSKYGPQSCSFCEI